MMNPVILFGKGRIEGTWFLNWHSRNGFFKWVWVFFFPFFSFSFFVIFILLTKTSILNSSIDTNVMSGLWNTCFHLLDGCTGLTGRRTPQRATEGRSRKLGWTVHITKCSWPARRCCGPMAWVWTFPRESCTGLMLITTVSNWFTLTPPSERLVTLIEYICRFINAKYSFTAFWFVFPQVVYEGQELNHAFGLCHYKQFLFWNEYRGGSIYKLDQGTKTVTLLRNERPPIFEIRVYDAQQQQGISRQTWILITCWWV